MATIALAYSQQRPTLITSTMSQGGTANWSNLLRVPVGDLTSGTAGEYSIVAFGHVGKFTTTDTSSMTRFANVALRFDTGASAAAIGQTLSRVPMAGRNINGPLYTDGAGASANRGHPFMIVYHVPAGLWVVGTDLVLSATIEYTAGTSHGSFWVDSTAIMVFDHSEYTVVSAKTTTVAALPYKDAPPDLTALNASAFPTTGRWICFYSAQVAPGQTNPQTVPYAPSNYWMWLARSTDGVVVDPTFGINGQAQITGCQSRSFDADRPADPLEQLYHLGGWFPCDVANGTTNIQLHGWSNYDAVTASPLASFRSAHFFAVREDAFTDSASDAANIIPTSFNRSAFQSYQTLTTSCGDDRPKFVSIGMSTMYDGTQPTILSGANYMAVSGLVQTKVPANALNTTVAENGVDHLPNYVCEIMEFQPYIARYGTNHATLNGLLNPLAGYGADSSARFYSAFSFTPTDDPDRTPPTPHVITYTPITINKEIDIVSVPQLTDDLQPDGSYVIEISDGLTSFESEDGHVIRWPSWSKPRRAWRFRWTCDEARYNALFAVLYRPYDSAAVRLPAAFTEAPGLTVYVQPDSLTAEQLSGRLVWRVSCTATELVYV